MTAPKPDTRSLEIDGAAKRVREIIDAGGWDMKEQTLTLSEESLAELICYCHQAVDTLRSKGIYPIAIKGNSK